MVIIDIKKYIVASLLVMSTTMVMLPCAPVASVEVRETTSVTRYQEDMVVFDDEEGLIDADEKINPKELIKWWVPMVTGATKYLFVAFNKVYIWWHGSARRNVVRG